MRVVLSRVRESENSASVLGFAERGKAAATTLHVKFAGPPRLEMRSAEQRRVASAQVAWSRRAFARIIDPHAKRRRIPVIYQNRFRRCHNSFRIVRLCFTSACADAK